MWGAAVLAFVVIALITSEIARHQVITKGAFYTNDTDGGTYSLYLAYKAAVQGYTYENPGFSGTVPISSLGIDPAPLNAISPGNRVIRVSGGTEIVTWAASSPDLVYGMTHDTGNNIAIGTSNGSRWSTRELGDMGPLPLTVPVGDVVSFVTYTGAGF